MFIKKIVCAGESGIRIFRYIKEEVSHIGIYTLNTFVQFPYSSEFCKNTGNRRVSGISCLDPYLRQYEGAADDPVRRQALFFKGIVDTPQQAFWSLCAANALPASQ